MAAAPKTTHLFRRIVINLGDASPAEAGMFTAARLARRFHAELVGLYVEDTRLLEWSSVPTMRQLSTAPRAEPRMTPEQLARDYAAAAAVARQRLAKVCKSLGLPTAFTVQRGDATSLAVEYVRPDDLLVIVEPSDPIARSAYPFREIVAVIARAAAPILYLPHRLLDRTGPVVVIARSATDRTWQLAAEAAAALDERLIVLKTTGAAAATAGHAAGPADAQEIERVSADIVDKVLARTSESLIVIDRQLLSPERRLFSVIAAQRAVPILVVGEPAGESG